MKIIFSKIGDHIFFRLIIIVILSLAFTVLCVQTSKRIGRLSSAPNYDDCTYFLSGALLKNAFQDNGIQGVREIISQRGIHSPYSESLSAVAYSLLGNRETSPYYANIIVVIAYLSGIGWFLRSLPAALWIAGLVTPLTVPFITMGVVEFRPDIAWAVVTGFGVVWIITNRSVFSSIGTAIFSGFLFGMALLIKPSTFVMTALLFSGAILSRLINWFLIQPKKPHHSKLHIALGVIALLTSVILIAGPYYLYYWKETWRYFWDNSFGINKAVWTYQGSPISSILFYISGDGWKSNLRFSGTIIAILGFVAGVFVYKKEKNLRDKMIFMFLAAIGALTVNTLAGMKSPFLGGAIYGIWFFGSAYCIGEYWNNISDVATHARTFTRVLMVCCSLAFVGYTWPRYSNWSKDPTGAKNYLLANQAVEQMLEKQSSDLPKSILFVQSGPVVKEDIGLWFAFHKKAARLESAAFCRSKEDYGRIYTNNDWIILQEPKTMGYTPSMPCEGLITNFKKLLDADHKFRIISESSALDGKKIWVYSK